MNTNNLELGIAIANANRGINSSLIYDELGDKLKTEFGTNVSIDRNDRDEELHLRAGALDIFVSLDITISVEITATAIAIILWNVYEKYIKSQQIKSQSNGIYISDMKHDIHFMLDKEYAEKQDFVNAFIDKIYENNKEN